jgi:hypothetical protein
VMGIFKIGSVKLFARAGFKPQSSWSLPLARSLVPTCLWVDFFYARWERGIYFQENCVQFSQHHLLKRLSFLQCMFLTLCQESDCSWALVPHVCNPSYLGDWDREDCSLRPAWANNWWDLPPPKSPEQNGP